MTIRCKFVCTSKREFRQAGTDGPLYDYEFSAVYTGSDENKMFWRYTPSGKLNVTSVTDGQFEPGKEYYLDLTPAWVVQ